MARRKAEDHRPRSRRERAGELPCSECHDEWIEVLKLPMSDSKISESDDCVVMVVFGVGGKDGYLKKIAICDWQDLVLVYELV